MRQIDRLHYMDSLRAFAMFLGLVLHAALVFAEWNMPPFRSHVEPSLFLQYICELIHVFRMELFFLVAGFFAVLLCQKRGTLGFAKNRAQRIVIPFLLSVAILMPWIAGQCLLDMNQSNASFLSQYWSYFTNPSYIWKESNPVGDWFWHFWFLYLLALFITAFFFAQAIWRKFEFPRRMAKKFLACISGNWGILILTIATYPIVLFARPWADVPGIGTSANILIYYWLFFAMGALFFIKQDVLEKIEATLKYHYIPCIISLIILLPLIGKLNLTAQPEWLLQDWELFSTENSKKGLGEFPIVTNPYNFSSLAAPGEWHLMALLRAYTTWCGIFCFIAFFRKFASHSSALGRYLADSSYFIYLLHFPVQLSLAYYLRDHLNSAILGFLICLITSLIICFLLYHFLCRPTVIGKLLSGKTYPLEITEEWADVKKLLKFKPTYITLALIGLTFWTANFVETKTEKKLIFYSLLGETKNVQAFLESNLKLPPQTITLHDGRNALHFAASKQGVMPLTRDVNGTIDLLIKSGISPDSRDSYGFTPLHYAVNFDNSIALKKLLSSNANPNAVEENYGNTPLHFAATYGKIPFIEALLSAGADPSLKRKDGMTPQEIYRKFHKKRWPGK